MTDHSTRVLAFSCSRGRPVLLRHCIMQLQRQTYPLDHAIYVNSPDGHQTSSAYENILADLAGERVMVTYGPTGSSHKNYLASLRHLNLEDYDLFLKIDDDDIYFPNYVEDVVTDYALNAWDYSGAVSEVHINGHRVVDATITCLGLTGEDRALGIPETMPSTLALSRRALRALFDIDDNGQWEDVLWRHHIGKLEGMKMSVRRQSNFVYNIHGGNVSTSSFLEP